MSATSILAISDFFRAQLAAREAATVAAMLQAFVVVREDILAQLDRLVADMEQAERAGDEISLSWLFRQDRYHTLLRQVEQQISELAPHYNGLITSDQIEAIQIAIDAFEQLTMFQLPPQVAVSVTFNRLPVSALEHLVGTLADGSPLRDLLDELGPDASKRVRDELIKGVGTGRNPRETARHIRDALDGNQRRANAIARTEQLRANRSASLETYRANADIMDGYIWHAELDTTTCAYCWAMHGTRLETEEDMATHVNCFPAGTLVSGPRVIGSSERWYSGPVVEVVTALGNRFTVTPNHPILTPEGWVVAGELREGGDVISAPLSERPLSSVNPDEYQVPALIEDVAQTLGRSGLVVSSRMPTAPEDFHGDGVGSEVHVIRADSELRDGDNAANFEPRGDLTLGRRNVRLPFLPRLSGLAFLGKGPDASFCSLISSLGIPPVLFEAAASHHQAIGLFNAANRNIVSKQPCADRGTRYSECFSKTVFRFTGEVPRNDFFVWKTKDRHAGRTTFTARFRSLLGRQLSDSDSRGLLEGANHYPALMQFSLDRFWSYLKGLCEASKRFSVFVPANKFVHPRPINRLAITPTTQRDATTDDGTLERSGVNMELTAEIRESLPIGIQTDRIVKVSSRMFSGHVYNLQTTHEWYNANGVIVHNCRCSPVPRTKTWAELGFDDVAETRLEVPRGVDVFETLTDAEKVTILGPAKFAAYQSGAIDLSDLIGQKTDPTWGRVGWERSLKDALGVRKARSYYQEAADD